MSDDDIALVVHVNDRDTVNVGISLSRGTVNLTVPSAFERVPLEDLQTPTVINGPSKRMTLYEYALKTSF